MFPVPISKRCRSPLPLVLVLSLLLAACGSGGSGGTTANADLECSGDSCGSNGPGTEPTRVPVAECGTLSGGTCAAGFTCVDDPSDSCEEGPALDCPGICVADVPPECEVDLDCLLPEDRCFECGDGIQVCPESVCAEGRCLHAIPDCPPPPPPSCAGLTGEPCPDGYRCVDDPSDSCDAGIAADCPGVCEIDPASLCRTDADCPPVPVACAPCADGSLACPRSVCDEAGRCRVDVRACPEPGFCGGFAGFECPEGMACVDDESDDCDPNACGADCTGICIPEVHDGRCGGNSESTCLPDEECIDNPGDNCDPAKGDDDCPGVCQREIDPICAVDADCPDLGIACSVCPDGSEVCPETSCIDGACRIAMPACPAPPSCGVDGQDCGPGFTCVEDPADVCDGADACSRICVPDGEGLPRCGGFAGEECPPGYVCIDDPGDDCEPDGGADCGGVCTPAEPRECATAADCPRILAPCVMCPNESVACPLAYCDDGRCGVAVESCPDPAFCGGIAGFPCPEDSECIDDPGDDCDPNKGGADCAGICVPREQAPPECQADSDCVTPAGPCRECPDGSGACPSAICRDGFCEVSTPVCSGASQP